jgi:hypothetical protein
MFGGFGAGPYDLHQLWTNMGKRNTSSSSASSSSSSPSTSSSGLKSHGGYANYTVAIRFKSLNPPKSCLLHGRRDAAAQKTGFWKI